MLQSLTLAAVLLTAAPAVVAAPPAEPSAPAQATNDARRLIDFERAMNALRARYFDANRTPTRRALGAAAVERTLRAEPDPRKFSIAWRVFARADGAARVCLQDAFAADASDGAWTMLAWLALRQNNPLGERARALLQANAAHARNIPIIADLTIGGVLNADPAVAHRASFLADAIDLHDAVPAMIVGQIWPPNARSGAAGRADLVYVRSTKPPIWPDPFDPNYLARLESAEARMAGSGVIEVQRRTRSRAMPRDFSQPSPNRQAVFHRAGTHASLVRLTTRAWGRPTDHMAWDVEIWKAWYIEEFQGALGMPRQPSFIALWPTP